jgi:endonuclease YncB( thermonuclease family)
MNKSHSSKQLIPDFGLFKLRLHLTAFLCVILTFPIDVSAEAITGRVIGVASGDTIIILDDSNIKYKIRLSGIDAPEKAQPYGDVSAKSLSGLVYGKEVDVEWLKLEKTHHRAVGKVLLNGVDINLEQVKLGMAWFFLHYQNEQPAQDRIDYANAQTSAEDKQIGLWADKNPTPPWEFRKQGRIN